MKKILKGTRIDCPNCKLTIALAAKNIFAMGIIKSSDFIFLDGKDHSGEYMDCPDCGSAYSRRQIFTDKGWI